MDLYAIVLKDSDIVVGFIVEIFEAIPSRVIGDMFSYVKLRRYDSDESALSDDFTGIIIRDGTNIPLSESFSHLGKFVVDRTTGVISKTHNYDEEFVLDNAIPMAFKRANTVVNLGRL